MVLKIISLYRRHKKNLFLLTYPAVRAFKIYRQWPNNIQGSGLSDREISFLMDRKGIERELLVMVLNFTELALNK